MNAIAIKIAPSDNVVTVLRDVSAGDVVTFAESGEERQLVAKQSIPIFHKMSVCLIQQGEHAFKYGESIGEMTRTVESGMWVSHENITGLPRNYAGELDDE